MRLFLLGLATLSLHVLIACGSTADFSSSSKRSKGTASGDQSTATAEPKTDPSPSDKYISPTVNSPLKDIDFKVAVEADSLPLGSALVGVFKYSLLKDNFDQHSDEITRAIGLPRDSASEVIGDEFVASLKLARAMSRTELRELVGKNLAIVALAVDETSKSVLKATVAREDERIAGIASGTKTEIQTLASSPDAKRVKVAVIDTGLDSSGKEFASTFLDPRMTDVLGSSNVPTDKVGHGTQIASIIGSSSLGIAAPLVEIIPLKVTENGELSVSTLLKAIVTGTNLGAEVINMSLAGETFGCTPIVGHMMFKAIEKGVFFSISAGNGVKYQPEVDIGLPVTAASDDGPLNFQRTAMPACWGKYFLGAMAVGAVAEDGGNGDLKMPLFSNYGEDVEIAAPGVSVPTIKPGDTRGTMTGTSASAAYVSAAAAIAIHHHRARGYAYTPWYIENLLVESARLSEGLAVLERRPRFGSVLDFGRLVELLRKTETMSPEDRQKIPTVNPRYYEGWLPGRESRLAKLWLETATDILKGGTDASFRSVVTFGNGDKEQDVTGGANSNWALSFTEVADLQSVGPSHAYVNFSSKGQLRLDATKLSALRAKLASARSLSIGEVKSISLSVVSVYDEAQHQVYQVKPVKVMFDAVQTTSTELAIGSQNSLFRVGQPSNWFKLTAKSKAEGGAEVVEDVTGAAQWRSSAPKEFEATSVAGVFSAEKARIGASYTVFASYGGKEVSQTIKIENETYKDFEIHNSLGSDGAITVGQTFKLTSQIVFDGRKQPVKSDWFVGDALLASNVSEVSIDTSKMNEGILKTVGLTVGDNIFTAKSKLNTESSTTPIVASHKATLTRDITKIEVLLKDPIVKEGGELLLNLKVYYDNNSNQVITGATGVTWTVSHPAIVNIQDSGKATVAQGSAFTRITVTGTYKGKVDETSFYIVSGSPVTGSTTDLIDLEVTTVDLVKELFCYTPPAKVYAIYKDGLRREVTSFASISYKVVHGSTEIDNSQPSSFYGGDTLRMFVAYNDGSPGSGGAGSVIKTHDVPVKSGTLKNLALQGKTPGVFSSGEQWSGRWTDYLDETDCYLGLTTEVTTPFFDATTKAFVEGSYTLRLKWLSQSTGAAVQHQLDLPISVVKDRISLITPYYGKGSDVKIVGDTTTLNLNEGPIAYYPEDWDAMSYFQFYAGATPSDFTTIRPYYAESTEDFLASVFKDSTSVPVRVSKPSYARYQQTVFACVNTRTVGALKFSMKDPTRKISAELAYTTTATPNLVQDVSVAKAIPDLLIPTRNPTFTYCTTENRALTPFAGGAGTKADPYRVCTPDQLVAGYNKAIESGNPYIALEDDLDFANKTPLMASKDAGRPRIDGKNHQIKNFVAYDSERNHMAIFPRATKVANLYVKNSVIRGNFYVGVVCGQCQFIDRVFVEDSTVSGSSYVGGLAGEASAIVFSGLMRSKIYSNRGYAGGLAGQVQGAVYKSFAQGDVLHNGVPGLGFNLGGIAGEARMVVNTRFLGNVSGSQSSYTSSEGVGGIVGSLRVAAVYNLAEGYVINAGSSVGGIVGQYSDGLGNAFNGAGMGFGKSFEIRVFDQGEDYYIHEIYQDPYPRWQNQRSQALIGNTFKGTVIGGTSRERLFCVEGIKEVLGSEGSITCDGDTKDVTGTGSAAGGIVGLGRIIYARDNVFEGKVRSPSESGGIFGRHIGFAPLLSNAVKGQVSVSNVNGAAGKYMGTLEGISCSAVLDLATTGSFVKLNSSDNGQTLSHVAKYIVRGGIELNRNFP